MRTDTIVESVLNPTTHAFCVHADTMALWNEAYRVANPLTAGSLGIYQTYGDGTTRHSGESVVTEYFLEDACLSIAAYLLRTVNPAFDQSHLDMFHSYDNTCLKFVASLRKANKRRWYSVSEQKVGTSDKLRHDKRYVEFPEDIEGGTLRDCVNLYWLGQDPNGSRPLFRRLQVIFDFADILGETSHYEIEKASGLDCSTGDRDIVNSFRTLRYAFAMIRDRDDCMRQLDNCTRGHAARKRNASLAAA